MHRLDIRGRFCAMSHSRKTSKRTYPPRPLSSVTMPDYPNSRRVSAMTDSPISFDVIPAEHWGPPDWINGTRAEQVRKNMGLLRIPHGGRRQATFHSHACLHLGQLIRQRTVCACLNLLKDPLTLLLVALGT